MCYVSTSFFFQAEDGIRDRNVTGVQTCALPICLSTLESELRAHGGELAAEKTDSAFVLSAVLPTRRQEQSTHDDRAVEATRDVDESSTGRTKLRQRLILASTAAIVVV